MQQTRSNQSLYYRETVDTFTGRIVAVPCSLDEWSESFSHRSRTQIEDVVTSDDGVEQRVSTVFLGLNHGIGQSPNLIYETMVFGGEHDGHTVRYENRDYALRGHVLIVLMLLGLGVDRDSDTER